MVSLSFIPTACINYREDVFLEESIGNYSIYMANVSRGGCIGSRTRRQQQLIDPSVNTEPFVAVVKQAIYIPPKMAIDRNVPWMLFLIALLSTFTYKIMVRLMYYSNWALFIKE
jgi:hypothetical protein